MRAVAPLAILLLACNTRTVADRPAPSSTAIDAPHARITVPGPNDPPAVPPCSIADGYQGMVAGQKVFARLGLSGSSLHGRYFYDKSGIDIPLAGTITAGNALRLLEGDPDKSTGAFAGACDPATGALSGTWTGKTSSEDFHLVPIGPGDSPVVATKQFAIKKRLFPPLARPGGLNMCSYRESWSELFGLRDPAVERSLNGQGLEPRLGPIFEKNIASDIEQCEGAFEESRKRTFSPTPHELLLVETGGWANVEASAHPENDVGFSRATFDLRTGKLVEVDDVFARDVIPTLLACIASLGVDETIDAGGWDEFFRADQFDLTETGVHFFGMGYPHAFDSLTGKGPTLPYDVLLRDGFLRADSPVKRAWQGVKAAPKGRPLCPKGASTFQ
jgi:hypothetical protein